MRTNLPSPFALAKKICPPLESKKKNLAPLLVIYDRSLRRLRALLNSPIVFTQDCMCVFLLLFLLLLFSHTCYLCTVQSPMQCFRKKHTFLLTKLTQTIHFQLPIWTFCQCKIVKITTLFWRQFLHKFPAAWFLKVDLCLRSQHLHNKSPSAHKRVLRSTHNNLLQLPTTCCESWTLKEKRELKRLPWGTILENGSLLQKGSRFYLNNHV